MFELFALFTMIALGFAVLGVLGFVFKLTFAVLLLPFTALFWVLGGLFKLVVLPFKLVGGILLALMLVPVLLIGMPILLSLGLPLLLLGGLLFGIWVVGSLVCWVGGALCGCV